MSEQKQPHVSQIQSSENVEAVRVAMLHSLSKLTRRATAELGITRRPIQRILHLERVLSHRFSQGFNVVKLGHLTAPTSIWVIIFFGDS